jgi:hypothetical protein
MPRIEERQMTDTVDHSSGQRHRGDQGPAFAAMRRFLDVHAKDRRRGALARFLGISPLGPAAIELFRAAEGESQVAEIVRALGPEWTVLNAVTIGSGHAVIDHALVGPAGVILVTMRRHVASQVILAGESLTVDGIRVDHLRNAAYETERVQTALEHATGRPIDVTHAVVLLGVEHIVHFGHRPAVAVLRPRDVGVWLRGRPRVFGVADVVEITTIAEKRVHWNADDKNQPNSANIEEQFAGVRDRVIHAEDRRRAVGVFIALAVLVSGIGFLAIAAPTVFSIFAR